MSNAFLALQIIAEQRISEAVRRGDLDNLPGSGQPLKMDDMENVPEELRMAYRILKNANCLPPELALRKEAANLVDLLENCKDEQQKLRQMRRLRVLLQRMECGSRRHMLLEENDPYYQKILARLANCGIKH